MVKGVEEKECKGVTELCGIEYPLWIILIDEEYCLSYFGNGREYFCTVSIRKAQLWSFLQSEGVNLIFKFWKGKWGRIEPSPTRWKFNYPINWTSKIPLWVVLRSYIPAVGKNLCTIASFVRFILKFTCVLLCLNIQSRTIPETKSYVVCMFLQIIFTLVIYSSLMQEMLLDQTCLSVKE